MFEDQEKRETISLESLKGGDRAEFARLVEAYSAMIYNLALRILNDPQDAEDVLQATFLKAWRGIREFEGRSSLGTWLYRIGVNEALMLARKRRPEISFSEEAGRDDTNDPPALTHPDVDWSRLPEQTLLSSEARRFLEEAVQRLSSPLKVVFLMRDVDGLSIRETAETLGLTEAVVKTRLLRARLKLRDELTGYYRDQLLE